MGYAHKLRTSIFTLTLDGVVYRCHEEVYRNGKHEYWTKVGSWVSGFHESQDQLREDIRKNSPLSPGSTLPSRESTRQSRLKQHQE